MLVTNVSYIFNQGSTCFALDKQLQQTLNVGRKRQLCGITMFFHFLLNFLFKPCLSSFSHKLWEYSGTAGE